MYISEIRLKNFKRFDDIKFSFDHGINVIKGQNEQGKTTLLKAMIAGLYMDPSSAKYRETYKSWSSNLFPTIELDFFVEDRLYIIEKNFNTKEAILRNIIEKTEEKNLAVITKQIKRFTGIGNENVLRSTACIQQDEMIQFDSGRKSLQEALQDASLNTGGVNILDLLKSLEDKLTEMQVGLYHPAKNNGIIKRLRDEVGERTRELTEAKTQESNQSGYAQKLENLETELKQVEGQLEKYTKTVAEYEKRDTMQKELDIVNERIKEASADVHKTAELSEKIKTLDAKMQALGGKALLDVLDSKQQEIISINHQLQDAQGRLAQLHVAQREPQKIEKKQNDTLLYSLISIIAFVFIIGGIIFSKIFVFLGLGIVVVDVLLLIFLKPSRSQKQIEEESQSVLEHAKQELADIQDRMDHLLHECFATSVDDYFSKRTQLVALNSDLIQTKATIDALLRDKTLDEINTKLRADVQKKAEIDAMLPPDTGMTQEQYSRDKREVELLQLDKKDIENEIAEEKGKIKASPIQPKQVVEKEEKLAKLQEELAQYEKHLAVLQAVYDALKKVESDVSLDVSENIQKYVNQTLPIVTNGKYEKLRMNNNFDISVYSKEKKEWIDPNHHLSKGAIDQIYLCARLALVDLVTHDHPIPLFFDDPFVTFDEERRELLMQELQKISQTRQIFIFTCHSFFDQYGKLIPIPATEK